MKRSISLMVAAIGTSLALGICGCGGSDSSTTGGDVNTSDGIVGNWLLTGIEQNGTTTPSPYVVDLVLRADGTVMWAVNGDAVNGTYTRSSSSLTMNFPANPEMNQTRPCTLSGNSLTLQMADNTYIFSRV